MQLQLKQLFLSTLKFCYHIKYTIVNIIQYRVCLASSLLSLFEALVVLSRSGLPSENSEERLNFAA